MAFFGTAKAKCCLGMGDGVRREFHLVKPVFVDFTGIAATDVFEGHPSLQPIPDLLGAIERMPSGLLFYGNLDVEKALNKVPFLPAPLFPKLRGKAVDHPPDLRKQP